MYFSLERKSKGVMDWENDDEDELAHMNWDKSERGRFARGRSNESGS